MLVHSVVKLIITVCIHVKNLDHSNSLARNFIFMPVAMDIIATELYVAIISML